MTDGSVSGALTSAVIEWIVIALLLIDAAFSYLITSLTEYFHLEPPCLLCSRLDHVIGQEKPGFCLEKLCRNHNLRVSSLVFCNLHERLVDIRGVCENCLLFFISNFRPKGGTYRLLPDHVNGDKDPLLPHKEGSCLVRQHCSCCNQPYNPSSPIEILVESITRYEVSGSKVVTVDDKGFKAVKSSASNIMPEPFYHIRYSKLGNCSDTDSDEIIPSKGDLGGPVNITGDAMESLKMDVLPGTQNFDLTGTKVCEIQPDTGELSVHVLPSSIFDKGSALKEPKWQDIEQMRSSPSLPEQTLSLHPSLQAPSPAQVGVDPLGGDDSEETREAAINEDYSDAITSPSRRNNVVVEETDMQVPGSMELAEAYKLATGGRKFSEEFSRKGSERINEDIKVLLSHMSSSRGIELSPRVSTNGDELRQDETSSSVDPNMVRQKSISLGSGSESLDGTMFDELEGEGLIDRLRRRIDHDRNLVNELYRELEEERNASAIAANQALAMITRLQKEKAELHMEALQYLRMMEEQAEYDNEALQKSNELVAEKEREVQDLEEKLTFYRNVLVDHDQETWNDLHA